MWGALLINIRRTAIAAALGLIAAGPATAAEVVSTGDNKIEIENNQGVLVRLEQPVNSVFVADPEIADVQVKSSRLVYVFGRKAGETTLFAVDSNDRVVVSERLEVRHNLAGLERALADLAPAQPIEVQSIGGSIVLTGSVPSPRAAEDARRFASRFAGAENVINRIEVTGPTQINLRVRVAEVSRTISKDFGLRWNALLESGDDSFSFFSSGASGTNQGAFGALSALGGAYSGGAAFDIGSASIDSMLDVLAEEGLVTMLSEPNLTAMSGETATFLAGGEFPIPVEQEDDGSITIEFKEFGVRLEFTPTLLDNGQISLFVAPEVSELDFANGINISGGLRIPALSTRRAATTVELASGQSFAIAGLLQNTQNHNVDKLPGLGDIPVLGALFKSDEFQRGETELAIIVTPYAVQPVSSQQLSAPTDRLLPPNDIERIFLGRMQGKTTEAAQAARDEIEGRTLAGPVGFMLE